MSGMSRKAVSRREGSESRAVIDSQPSMGLPRNMICFSRPKPVSGLGRLDIWLPLRFSTSRAGSSERGATESQELILLSSTQSTVSFESRSASETEVSDGAREVTPFAPKWSDESSGMADTSSSS
eukprot:scaffold311140_cov27-Tisochrysis_lutea.AAC.2